MCVEDHVWEESEAYEGGYVVAYVLKKRTDTGKQMREGV